jgi:hypothetical protein
MNSFSLISAFAGGLLTVISLQRVERDAISAPSKPATIPAVVRLYEPDRLSASARTSSPYGWSSTEKMLEEGADDFRKVTSEEIETCALVLEGMMRRSQLGVLESRNYLHTRLQALREHVDYARSELIKLPSSQGDENFIPAYAHFYRTMKSLEQAFAQAANELNGDI